MKLSPAERDEWLRLAVSGELRGDLLRLAEQRDRYLADPTVSTPEACIEFLIRVNEMLGHEPVATRPFIERDMKL